MPLYGWISERFLGGPYGKYYRFFVAKNFEGEGVSESAHYLISF